MNFEEFAKELKTELINKFGENSVTITNAVFLGQKEAAVKITYGEREALSALNPLYIQHTKGHVPISHLVSVLEDAMNQIIRPVKIDSGKILYRLVIPEENEELLKRVPHIPFYDMEIIFICQLDMDMQNRKNLIITNDVMTENNLSVSQLIDQAHENTFHLYPCQTQLLAARLLERTFFNPNSTMEDFLEAAAMAYKDRNDIPLYSVCCSDYRYGSAVILNNAYIELLANRFDRNLIFIPNGDREFILMPCPDDFDKKAFLDSNEYITSGKYKELLSKNIFIYDKDAKTLSILE